MRPLAVALARASLCCAALIFAAGCGAGAAPVDEGSADAGKDAAPADVPLPLDLTGTVADPAACPGGDGCACAADEDCDRGLCAPIGAGKRCTIPCGAGCPPGMACVTLSKKGEPIHHCVPAGVDLCNPCTATEDCASFGRGDDACVAYGGAGNFCGSACQGDADCPTGYACERTTAVEGGRSLQCVRKAQPGDPPGVYGECPCREAAIQAGLGTGCWKQSGAARCRGARGCTAAGLSPCSAAEPAAETCDGLDNDCDGLTDEDTCEDGNPCSIDACAAKGCQHAQATGPCNADDDRCTAPDVCKQGECIAGSPLDCDDGNECTRDRCEKIEGCVSEPKQGLSCDADGNQCTVGDACKGGRCRPGALKECDDSKACTLDRCEPKTGMCAHKRVVGLACDDGNPCTHTDLCAVGGGCSGVGLSCEDGNACTADSCDAKAEPGQGCRHVGRGGACEDGDPCSLGDTCASAACRAGKTKTCTPSGPCRSVYCDGLTGACVETAAKTGTGCDDGDKCTVAEACDSGGKCASGTKRVCDDGDPCTTDGCSAKTGCTATAAADGGKCDDGDACTVGTTCKSGQCRGGTPKSCDDQDVCTADSCATETGCVFKPLIDGKACDDGDKCTATSTCQAGACKGSPKNCPPGGTVCKPNLCNSASGKCELGPAEDGTTCDDGDACTESDGCTSGTCAGTPLVGKVESFAGKGGTAGVDIDGLSAVAVISEPAFVARSANGDLYLSHGDLSSRYEIRRINGGKVSTFAGGPVPGFQDGKGSSAQFRRPRGLAFDAAGNLWVADMSNQLIREITPDGTVSTPAGKGTDPGFGKSDAPGGHADGKGAAAKFNFPIGLGYVADKAAPRVVVADQRNQVLRQISSDGTVSTIVGQVGKAGAIDGKGTAAKLNLPTGIAVAGAVVYVSELGNHTIARVAADGTVTRIAGSGRAGWKDATGASAEFNEPYGLAIDLAGNILVADSKNYAVRQVAPSGVVTTVAGIPTKPGHKVGLPSEAMFKLPLSLVTDGAGLAYVVDQGEWQVLSLSDPYKKCKAK